MRLLSAQRVIDGAHPPTIEMSDQNGDSGGDGVEESDTETILNGMKILMIFEQQIVHKLLLVYELLCQI